VSTERLYRTKGIVIRRRNQGEADRVLALCTPSGKIEVIVKGARKTRSRKALTCSTTSSPGCARMMTRT